MWRDPQCLRAIPEGKSPEPGHGLHRRPRGRRCQGQRGILPGTAGQQVGPLRNRKERDRLGFRISCQGGFKTSKESDQVGGGTHGLAFSVRGGVSAVNRTPWVAWEPHCGRGRDSPDPAVRKRDSCLSTVPGGLKQASTQPQVKVK